MKGRRITDHAGFSVKVDEVGRITVPARIYNNWGSPREIGMSLLGNKGFILSAIKYSDCYRVKVYQNTRRIMIPFEIRTELGIQHRDVVRLYLFGLVVMGHKLNATCVFCGNTQELSYLHDKPICEDCAHLAASLVGFERNPQRMCFYDYRGL